MHLLTFIRLFHLLGLIMGLGGAVLLDATVFTRGVIRPVSQYTIHQAEVLSRVVSSGLVILWSTGIGLIWVNLMDKPEYLSNPKLWAKIAIVGVLTANGVFIHVKVLPMLKQRIGMRLFEDVSRIQTAALTLIGALSFVSWTTPFILGKASELNFVTPMSLIIAIYLAAVILVWSGLFAMISALTALQRIFVKIAAKATQPNEAWENAEQFSTVQLIPQNILISEAKTAETIKFAPRRVYTASKA